VLQREDDVLLGVAHGHEEHRYALGHVGAHPHQHLGAGNVRHLPIEHEEVEAFAACHFHGLAPAHVGVHVVAIIGDPPPQERQLVGVVF
jgi:hypothetical protein